eukprot:13658856-Ditylum_brightwellii.AAC.1
MACFVYHTKSCPCRMLTLVLTHGCILNLCIILGQPVSSAFFSRRPSEPSKEARVFFPINWIASTLAGRTYGY